MRTRVFLLALVAALVASGCSGIARVDPARYPAPAENRITFWGHACVFIDAGGTGIITDPVFEKSLLNRRRFIGAPPQDVLQRTRVVLLSHAHNDHTSPVSLKLFPPDVIVLCPEPVAKYLEGKGIAARAMRPGEETTIDGIRLIAIAVHHPGTRWSMHGAADGGALGWLIITPSATVFYSGDTDYCSAFSQVGWTYAPDIAVINVNGHLKAVDTARAARDTRAPVIIPAHWGAYTYWFRGGYRRPRGEAELKRLLGDRLHVLEVGGSLPLSGRPKPQQENVGRN